MALPLRNRLLNHEIEGRAIRSKHEAGECQRATTLGELGGGRVFHTSKEFGMWLTAGETEITLGGCWGVEGKKWKNYLFSGHKDKWKVS